jgi:hypothetical protein
MLGGRGSGGICGGLATVFARGGEIEAVAHVAESPAKRSWERLRGRKCLSVSRHRR